MSYFNDVESEEADAIIAAFNEYGATGCHMNGDEVFVDLDRGQVTVRGLDRHWRTKVPVGDDEDELGGGTSMGEIEVNFLGLPDGASPTVEALLDADEMLADCQVCEAVWIVGGDHADLPVDVDALRAHGATVLYGRFGRLERIAEIRANILLDRPLAASIADLIGSLRFESDLYEQPGFVDDLAKSILDGCRDLDLEDAVGVLRKARVFLKERKHASASSSTKACEIHPEDAETLSDAG